MTTADKTWTATTPAETDTEAQAYVNGYYAYFDNWKRTGEILASPYSHDALTWAWMYGITNALRSFVHPDPPAAGFPDTRPEAT